MRLLHLVTVGALALSAGGQSSGARIRAMKGAVMVRHDYAGAQMAGIVRAPLAAGDHINTADHAWADVEFDSAGVLRIGGNAEVRLVQLEGGHYQMQAIRGAITYRVRKASTATVAVETPSVSVRPANVGVYRIFVSAANESEITAQSGNVEVVAPLGSQWVNSGEKMMARGLVNPEFKIVSAIPKWKRAVAILAQCLQVASTISIDTSSGAADVQGGQKKQDAPRQETPHHEPPQKGSPKT